jgi:hydrogenase maturation factor
MDGYELAGRFSYITNALKYCGPEGGHMHFHKYISEKHLESKDKIVEAIKKFEALYPYLTMIAEKTGKDFLDYDVVEAYWMGNELLEKFNGEDMKHLINSLVKRGLPEQMGNKLIEKMPLLAIPFHAFHVFYVGVGNVTGHVKTTVQNMDNCRISIGEINQIIDTHLIVSTDAIVESEGKISLEETTKTIIYIPELLPDVKIGDIIAIHWGFACKKLDGREMENIKKYTKLSIEMKNSVV